MRKSLRILGLILGVLVLAGPRSRDVLKKLTDSDLSSDAFPWLTGKKISIANVASRCHKTTDVYLRTRAEQNAIRIDQKYFAVCDKVAEDVRWIRS